MCCCILYKLVDINGTLIICAWCLYDNLDSGKYKTVMRAIWESGGIAPKENF